MAWKHSGKSSFAVLPVICFVFCRFFFLIEHRCHAHCNIRDSRAPAYCPCTPFFFLIVAKSTYLLFIQNATPFFVLTNFMPPRNLVLLALQAEKRAERLSVSALTALSNFMKTVDAEANSTLCRRPSDREADNASDENYVHGQQVRKKYLPHL